MTRKQFRRRVSELLTASNKTMRSRIDRAIESGAVNYSDEPPESYRLTMAVATALLEDSSKQWYPTGRGLMCCFLREVNNIRACMSS